MYDAILEKQALRYDIFIKLLIYVVHYIIYVPAAGERLRQIGGSDTIEIARIALEKHTDHRGALIEIARRSAPGTEIRQVYLTVSYHGQVRGNHYHREKTEWIFVLKGECRLAWREGERASTKEAILSCRMPELAMIPPGIPHAIRNAGSEDMYALVIADKPFDPSSPDTYESYLL